MAVGEVRYDHLPENSMSYKLFLDDIRNPPDGSWVVARSMAAAVTYIQAYGFPRFISFDHDLGLKLKAPEQVDYSGHHYILIADLEDTEAPSGFDFAKWLVNEDLEIQWMSRGFDYQVHSANPVGAANIRGLLDHYLRVR